MLGWLLLAAAAGGQVPDQTIVGAVHFEGLARVSETFCRGQVVTTAGQPFSQTLLDEDVRRLKRSGKFLSVGTTTDLQAGQLSVTFVVVERPVIQSIEFLGNVKYSDTELLRDLDLAPGDPLSVFAVRQRLAELQQRYQDAGHADIRVSVDEAALRDEQRIVFTIEEGPRVRLREIAFEGNTRFPEGELRRKTTASTYLPLLRTGDFNPEAAERDAAGLQNFYRDRGFLDARTSYRTDNLGPAEDLRLVFMIEEGTQYHIGEIRFEDHAACSEAELQSAMQLQPGAVMRQDWLRADLETLRRRYGELGYLYATLQAVPDFTETPGEVRLTIRITEGRSYTINSIPIRGNQQTQDRVIRRELAFFPTELFDTSKVERSEKNLRSTGLFQLVTITPVGNDPEGRSALVDVVESDQTTNFIVGGGIGSNSGVAGTVSFEARNFDLFDWPVSWGEFFRGRSFRGAGQYFRTEFSPGSDVSSFRIDFREPYLLNRPVRLGTSLYLFERGREEYDEERLGGLVSLGKTLESGPLQDWSTEVAFRLEDVKIGDLEFWPAEDIRDAEGHNLIMSVQGRLVRNRTDQRFFPTEGDLLSLSYEQAFGDFTFGKAQASYKWYKTLRMDAQNRPGVLGLKGEAGYIVGDAPVFERFYAGGLGSLRGFEYRGVTPRDGPFFDDDQRIGGDFELLAGAEYAFPLFSDTFRGVVFSDMGTIEEGFELTDWRASVGFGVRIFIENFLGPIPIELNLALPIAKDGNDDTQVFSFAIGLTF